MKALSLYQPWAELVVLGHKKFETRSWATSYRGQLLIHASKRFTRAEKDFATELVVAGLIPDNLKFGSIIGSVNVADCLTTKTWIERFWGTPMIGGDLCEFDFGDYSEGRFAWQLDNAVQFSEPIPARGSLGLWEVAEMVSGK